MFPLFIQLMMTTICRCASPSLQENICKGHMCMVCYSTTDSGETLVRVLSRNELLEGKCALSRGLGPSPQENVSVPLSKHMP